MPGGKQHTMEVASFVIVDASPVLGLPVSVLYGSVLAGSRLFPVSLSIEFCRWELCCPPLPSLTPFSCMLFC